MTKDVSLINADILPRLRSRSSLLNFLFSVKEIRDARSLSSVAQLIFTAISSITIVITIAVVLFSSIASYIAYFSRTGAAYIAALATISLASFFAGTRWQSIRIRRVHENKEWTRDLNIKQVVTIASVRSQTEIYYRYRYIIRPRRALRTIRWSYIWAGKTKPEIVMLNPRHSFETDSDQYNSFLIFDLGRVLTPRDTEVIDFYIHVKSDDGEHLPDYFSFIVSTPSMPKWNTYLCVEFLDQNEISQLYRSSQTSLVAGRDREEWPVLDFRSIDTWLLPIRLGVKYTFRWNWAKL